MPLYEYKCDNCGNVFEVVQKFADPYLTVHESCGGGPVHRLLSVPQLQFKGSGFYITDYARGSGPGSAPTNSAGKKSEATADAGSGSKPESGSGSSAPAAAPAAASTESKSTTTSSSASDKK